MYNFDKKQKIILGILVAIVVGFVCYYVYAKEDESNTQIESENSLEVQDEDIEGQEGYSDDVILIHVSGAVNQEGVVELKANGRISDAIDKARRS